jgi:hypothetical protein
MVTGWDADIVACPAAGSFAFIAASVVSVAAPVGSGRAEAETGWVACQNVPVTATLPLMPTFHVPDWVTAPMTFAPVAKAGREAKETGTAEALSWVSVSPPVTVTVPEIDTGSGFVPLASL